MARKAAQRVAHADNQIRIKTVTCMDELSHVFAVRAITLMEEGGLPVSLAYDGNDFQATHVLMYCDDEPIGAVRLRWFEGFAQFDRTVIRPSYRNGRALKRMADFAFAHASRKGFSRFITHASPVYARLWERHYGFKRRIGRPALKLEGYSDGIVELERMQPVPSNAITPDTPPDIIHRIEGAWETETAFQRSA